MIFVNGNVLVKSVMEQALEKYVDQFGQNFPIMAMRGTPESEIIGQINIALNTGVPYELPPDDLNIVY